METRSGKRRKFSINECDEEENSVVPIDRISDLSDAVLHHILSLLPIKSIAQTSVLSKRFRSIWSTFPDLDFTTITHIGSISSSPKSIRRNRKKCYPFSSIDFINKVLSLRHKESDIRALRFRARLSFSHLNSLFRRSIRQNVQELHAEVANDGYFNLPRCVVTSQSLRALKLRSRYPGLRLPPLSVVTSGFKFLHTLSLSFVLLSNQSSVLDLFTESSFQNLKKLYLNTCIRLKNLKIGCRNLEDVTVENCSGLDGLEICGGKLERLIVSSCFDMYSDKSWVKIDAPRLKSILWEYNAITGTSCLEKLRALEEASIGRFALQEEKDVSVEKLQSVSNFVSALSHARSLTLQRQCVEILSNKNYWAHLLHPFNSLKYLKLHTGFNKHNIPAIAWLFRSSPTLHILILMITTETKSGRRQWNRDMWDMSVSEDELYWESQTCNLKPFLENLRVVRIHGFLEYENEVCLAKFLLKHGKALQEMTLCPEKCNSRDSLRRQKVRSQMMGFSWASSNAKFAFQ
ncbi:putative F-box/FBD/LRR-repeat protein [Tripterygium wilfordii]|uniref:Putative F-box/FBD/LRR-repeat protein n=1 Tax=Tripterygium wilfordii TaxID=458696 RepID=A0A7J7BX18_TRIWF|nr:putative F-box/FBD/LRR-repeat protein At4g03220 [Tripterygium wilfordii]KAF5726423.1 putative F-box/FBD/LRR-repeat protein [Tripterygium wilfordii]